MHRQTDIDLDASQTRCQGDGRFQVGKVLDQRRKQVDPGLPAGRNKPVTDITSLLSELPVALPFVRADEGVAAHEPDERHARPVFGFQGEAVLELLPGNAPRTLKVTLNALLEKLPETCRHGAGIGGSTVTTATSTGTKKPTRAHLQARPPECAQH